MEPECARGRQITRATQDVLQQPDVVHLTSVHPPFDTRIFHKECSSLADAGWRVSLVVAAEVGGTVDGVAMLTIPRESSRLRRFILSPWRVLAEARQSGARVCHFHDPELMPIGMILRLLGRMVVYDVHEDVPRQILSKQWIPPWLRRPVALATAVMEWITSRLFFSAVVAATPTIAQRFPGAKTVLVRNYPIHRAGSDRLTMPFDARDKAVAYVGGIDENRGILQMLKAIDEISDITGRLVLAGRFSEEELEKTCRRMPGWRKVDYLGWLSQQKVREVLVSARCGLVTLLPTPSYVDSYPVKLFEYMSAGLPVIASDFPLWREIIDGAKCGLLVDPLDPAAIARAIEWIFEHPEEAEAMGRRGQEAVRTTYNWGREEKKLLELYETLMA